MYQPYGTTTQLSPKNINLCDPRCPHTTVCPPMYLVRVYATSIRYDGACYCAPCCGDLVIPMRPSDAHKTVRQGHGEWACPGDEASLPGSCGCKALTTAVEVVVEEAAAA